MTDKKYLTKVIDFDPLYKQDEKIYSEQNKNGNQDVYVEHPDFVTPIYVGSFRTIGKK